MTNMETQVPAPTTDFDREMVAMRQVYEALFPIKEERRAAIIKAVAILLNVNLPVPHR